MSRSAKGFCHGLCGSGAVFALEESITPGEDWRRVIEHRLDAASVVIVVIGFYWLDVSDTDSRRRIDDPADLVAAEIASGLERSAPVIPVLVGGASMPAVDALPPALTQFAYRNALAINDTRFHQDMDQLIAAIAPAALNRAPEWQRRRLVTRRLSRRVNRLFPWTATPRHASGLACGAGSSPR
jgi:hypothetical protein